MYVYIHIYIYQSGPENPSVNMVLLYSKNGAAMTTIYGVATISRLLKIIGLFCKRAL